MRYDALVRVGESKDGKPIFLTIDGTFAPLYNSNGEVVQLVGSAVDITLRVQAEGERRKLEAQIQHSQKLESLGILAGGIAHDFNNLLVAILGNASLVLEELPADSIIVEDVQDIELAAKRAAELWRELLAYAGKGNFVVKALDLNTLITEMGQLLSVSISKWPLLNYDLAQSLPPIMIDATQLRQVVMNLITNASEAIGDNEGSITMKTGVTQCTQAQLAEYFSGDHLPDGDYVFLDVIDSGTGIQPDDLPQLFDPFFTTKFTGRGLGLASVIGIVRGHGGALRVSSTPGKGATFRVLFPCTESAVTETIQTPHDLEDWQSEGVALVVDDEEKVRTLAGRMLERVGFTVVFAKDGVEAVEIFESRQDEIRFVLLDLTMPRMRGEEAFKRIRAIRHDVPVLFSSGYTEEDVLDRLKSESRIMFVQKPYTVGDLNKTVRKMFVLIDSP